MPSFKTIDRQIQGVVFIANGLGAGLVYFFFNVLAPTPAETVVRTPETSDIVILSMGMTVLFLIGFFVAPRVFGLNTDALQRWYEKPTGILPELEQRRALTLPLRYALLVLTIWFFAWLLFSLVANFPASISPQALPFLFRSFIGTVIVGGIITSAICYFAIDAFWRQTAPVFFPSGKLSQVKVFRLSVRRRLLIVLILVGVWPINIVSTLALDRARSLIGAPNPELIVENLTLLLMFTGFIAILTSVGMTIFVTRSIVGPLRALQEAMSRVEQNDLTAQVPVVTNDELGYVSERFNAMTAGLRQGELLRNLLNIYVSPEVARVAVERGVALGGEQVNCTVLFSDIRGFTSLSEQLLPADLIALLNRYMSAMVAAVVAEGGVVNKFGGDSILAIFGTPLNPDPDHAARAIRAALGMRRALEHFNREQAERRGPQLKIGIGLATGPVVAGNLGGEGRIEYTVIGDTVNLASRLQSLTKELGHDTLAADETYHAASQTLRVTATALPAVEVRGKKEAVTVWAL